MHELNPLLADPFESQQHVFKDKARWQLLCAVQTTLLALFAVIMLFLALRPPVVIIKDRLHAEAPVLSTGNVEPPISVADARVFFINMLKLRLGWDSLTVSRDMQTYLGQCYRDQRHTEMAHLQELVTLSAPKAGATAAKKPRLAAWVAASISNTLVLPARLEDVQCLKKAGIWHCSTQGSVITQNLVPPFITPAPLQALAFAATLLEVRHTPGTPYGLIVGAMRQFPRQATAPKEAS